MNAADLLLKVTNKTLTCSEVVQLLMEQTTFDETSHAHLHTLETFKHDESKWAGNFTKMHYNGELTPEEHIARKRHQWAPDAHLTPATLQSRRMYGNPAELQALSASRPYDVFMNQHRLANSNTYNERTGRTTVTAARTAPNLVKKSVLRKNPGGGKPTSVEIFDSDDITQYPYTDSTQYQHEAGAIKVITRTTPTTYPVIPKAPSHSLFPDSESMVLHLTAALLSDAGLRTVTALQGLPAGGLESVGVFSKTAVKTVAALPVASKPPAMLERTADVSLTSYDPFTKTFTVKALDIDHVVVVLKLSAGNEVVLTTCYPSNLTTGASIGTATADSEDIAEPTFGTHEKIIQKGDAPVLKW